MWKIFMLVSLTCFGENCSYLGFPCEVTHDSSFNDYQTYLMLQPISKVLIPESFLKPKKLSINLKRWTSQADYQVFEEGGKMDITSSASAFAGSSTEEFIPFITAHEFGHALFDVNMETLLKPWGKVRTLYNQSRIYNDQRNELIQNPDPGKEKILNEKIEAWVKETKENILYQIEAPYNEFFADVISIGTFKECDGLKNAVVGKSHSANNDGHPELSEPRSFCKDISFEQTSNYMNTKYKENIPYIISAPTRFYVWNKYLNNPNFNTSKVFEAILKGIANELNRRVLSQEWTISVKDFNQNLQKSIDEQMSKI